jgi:transporter family-2 protein
MRERRPVVIASWIALGAGILGAIQPRINATLAERANSAVLASWINFVGAWIVIVVIVAVRKRTRNALVRFTGWSVPWWTLTAGLGGVCAVLAGAIAANTLGIAIFSVAFYSGQLSASLLVDRSGLRAGERHAITATRGYGASIALVAVAVTQVGRPVGDVRADLILMVVAAGGTTAFQAAFNGRMAAASGDTFAATFVNVTGGALALTAVVVTLLATGLMVWPRLPTDPLLYSGGLLGVAIVASFAMTTQFLGVLRTTMGMLAGQLATALAIDWLIGDITPTLGVLAGAALISIAVALVGRQPAATRLTVSK